MRLRRHHASAHRSEWKDSRAVVVEVDDRPTGAGVRPGERERTRALLRRIADQLTIEGGVYPSNMPTAGSVDDMIDLALAAARDLAGIPQGSTVVLTAGRRTGTPGATNLAMVREIP